jgi:hypothetical protein
MALFRPPVNSLGVTLHARHDEWNPAKRETEKDQEDEHNKPRLIQAREDRFVITRHVWITS